MEITMNSLETSIESLTAEYTALNSKLEQIDQQYRVERPLIVTQIGQLAKALSALTGKPVAGATGSVGRKPMSEAGKAAIKAGLEKSRAAKLANAGGSAPVVPAARQPFLLATPPNSTAQPRSSQLATRDAPTKSGGRGPYPHQPRSASCD
jgi:hypothetical protein